MVIDRLKRLLGGGGSLSATTDLEVREAESDAREYYVPRVAVEWTWEATDVAYYVYVATPETEEIDEFGGAGASVAHGYEESSAEPRRVAATLDAATFGTAVSRARGAGYPEGDPRLFVGGEPDELTLGVAAVVGYEDRSEVSLLLELAEEGGLKTKGVDAVVEERTFEF